MRPALLIAALFCLACNDTDGAFAPTSDNGMALESLDGATAAGQERHIIKLMDAQTAAWTAHDAVAYGNTYAEAATFIAPVGVITAGRDGITAQHTFLFNPVNGPFRQSMQSLTLRRLTFLTGKYAVVELDVTLTGHSSLPPGLSETEPGVVRTRVTWIAARLGAEWKIAFQQMTPIAAM